MAWYSFNLFAVLSVLMLLMLCIADADGSPVFEEESRRMTHWEQCETSSDCSEDECCVSLRKSAVKYCKKRPRLGNLCNPSLKPGQHYSCPCSLGLTCALTSMDNYGRREKYQCVLVPEEESEREPKED